MAVKELRSGEAVVGTMIRMVRNPGIVLLAANAGLDFIMFDMEHGAFNFETIADAASMARTRGLIALYEFLNFQREMFQDAWTAGLPASWSP